MSRRSWRPVAVCLLLPVAVAGCDLGSSGRGSYAASLTGDGEMFGAALLLVTGEGLIGAEGTGGTLAWSGPILPETGEMRLLLVDPGSSGIMTFRLTVRDVSAPVPSFTFLQVVDRDNRRVTQGDTRIRLER